MEVSRPEFSEVTWKVKALALGEGEAAFLCGYGLCALEPGSALPEGQMGVTGEQPREGPVLGGLWKEPETARTPGHPRVTRGKRLQRCVLDSAELEGAYRGSSGDPRDHARPHAGNLSTCRRVSTSFGIWGWREVAKLKGRPQKAPVSRGTHDTGLGNRSGGGAEVSEALMGLSERGWPERVSETKIRSSAAACSLKETT